MTGFVKFLCLLFISLTVAQRDIKPEEQVQSILRIYKRRDPITRPAGAVINVTVNLNINSINKLDPAEGYIDIDGWLLMEWEDSRLAITDDRYTRNTSTVALPIDYKIWNPDIYLYNDHASKTVISEAQKVVRVVNGSVIWVPPIHIVAACPMSLEDYPNDEHECRLTFGSWVYSASQINIQLQHGVGYDLSAYRANPTWVLDGVATNVDSKIYDCCPNNAYQSFTYRLKLSRADSSLYYGFLVPAVFVALLLPFHFLIHPDAKERVTLCVALLIAAIVLLLGLESTINTRFTTIPRIVKHYVVTVGVVSIALIISIFHLLMYNRGGRHGRLAAPFRKIFLTGINSIFCVTKHEGSPKQVGGAGGDHGGSQTSSRLESQMDEVLSIMRGQAGKGNNCAVEEDYREEWRQFVMVLDRIWFLIFFIIFIVYTAILLG